MKKRFFYIAAGRQFDGTFKTKVGISDSPEKRLRALRGIDYTLELYAVLQFEDTAQPRQLEKLCMKRFARSRWTESYDCGDGFVVQRNRAEYFHTKPGAMLKFAIAQIPCNVKVVRTL